MSVMTFRFPEAIRFQLNAKPRAEAATTYHRKSPDFLCRDKIQFSSVKKLIPKGKKLHIPNCAQVFNSAHDADVEKGICK